MAATSTKNLAPTFIGMSSPTSTLQGLQGDIYGNLKVAIVNSQVIPVQQIGNTSGTATEGESVPSTVGYIGFADYQGILTGVSYTTPLPIQTDQTMLQTVGLLYKVVKRLDALLLILQQLTSIEIDPDMLGDIN